MNTNKILLVEDEFLIALQKKRQLENYGYEVVHLPSGEEAVEYVLNEHNSVDLILMDINLGEMLGTEAAEIILSRKEIPIVFFSSHSEPEVVRQTENITSYGYVLKDSSIVVLDASIKMALKLFEAKKQLNRSENFRKRIFESSKIPFIILETENFTCIDCNDAALSIHNIENKSDILGKTILDFSAPIQYDGVSSQEKVASIVKLAIEDGSVFFEWKNQKASGIFWDSEIHMLSFKSDGKLLLQYSIFDVTEKRKIELENRLSIERAVSQRRAIAQMVSDPVVFGNDLIASMSRVNQYITDTLGVKRSGIWMMNEDRTELIALSILDIDRGLNEKNIILKTSDFTNYFKAILKENRIYSEDALEDSRTSDLKEYLVQYDVKSLLDAGFFVHGKFKGVVCSEHIEFKRAWYSDEESFISTVAAVVGQRLMQEVNSLDAIFA